MKELEERILKDGDVKPGNILKVDSFLNHMIDVGLLERIGEEFYHLFINDGVNKILTIEASGIAIACMAARYFKVPVVFAKKAKSKNIGDDVISAKVRSFTYGKEYDVTVSRKYLSAEDRVLIIDDFLAEGQAMNGLIEICEKAGATVAGLGVCIEKGFQPGGEALRQKGYKLESLAIVESMTDDAVTFRA